MISIEDDIAQSMERALLFNAFLNDLLAPTEAQLWLERAAAQLRADSDPDGAKKQRRDRVIAMVMQRDGNDCWFCGRGLGRDITIEHLNPLALGGGWNDDNLALAHAGCNQAAGHLRRYEKEKLREQMRDRTNAIRAIPRDAGAANNRPASDK